MDNMLIYDSARAVPEEAKKEIKGGRLKGMTDINPMWRIKTLTALFGPCGFGWYYEITDKWIETTMAKDEITANVKINLYVKTDEGWSKPIQGVGGSMLVASERNGLYVNDECYKMALTDAISVACKSLGVGADVYWEKDNTKYADCKRQEDLATDSEKKMLKERCKQLNVSLYSTLKAVGLNDEEIKAGILTKEQHGKALINLKKVEESQNEVNNE